MSTSDFGCLLDTVRFGLEARFEGLPRGARDRLTSSLARQGWLDARLAAGPLKLQVPFSTGRVEGRMQATLFLREEPSEDGLAALIIGNASEVRLSCLELLRAHLGEEGCGPVGLDGKTNVVGPTADRAAELLPVQLEFFRVGLDGLVNAIAGAFDGDLGEVRMERLWLRTAEVTADLPAASAVESVRSMQRAALQGSVGAIADCYRLSAGASDGGPVLRWFRDKGGPVAKIYSKRADLVRAEVTFPKRGSFERVGSGQAEVGGEEAVELLWAFVRRAAPLLAEVVQHVGAAQRAIRSLARLVLDLQPLAKLAEGVTAGRGRRPSEEARRVAVEALDALLTLGAFSARGLPVKSAAWTVLRQLSEDGGPLVRWPGSNIYTVRAGG